MNFDLFMSEVADRIAALTDEQAAALLDAVNESPCQNGVCVVNVEIAR